MQTKYHETARLATVSSVASMARAAIQAAEIKDEATAKARLDNARFYLHHTRTNQDRETAQGWIETAEGAVLIHLPDSQIARDIRATY